MNDNTPDEQRHIEVLKAIKGATAPLSAIALLGLVDEFYSKDERTKLYAEYAALRQASQDAYAKLDSTGATVEPGIGWEARVKKYGQEAATEQMRPHMEALERNKEANQNLNEFEREHPMIRRLLRLKGEIGKASYEQ